MTVVSRKHRSGNLPPVQVAVGAGSNGRPRRGMPNVAVFSPDEVNRLRIENLLLRRGRRARHFDERDEYPLDAEYEMDVYDIDYLRATPEDRLAFVEELEQSEGARPILVVTRSFTSEPSETAGGWPIIFAEKISRAVIGEMIKIAATTQPSVLPFRVQPKRKPKDRDAA